MTVSPSTPDDPDATHEAAATLDSLLDRLVLHGIFGSNEHLIEEARSRVAVLVAAAGRTDKLEEALGWFDFIEDVEAAGPDDEPCIVRVTRTNAGWHKAKIAYLAALASVVRDG